MNRNTKIILIAVVLALIFANGISFWLGYLHSRQSATIQKVTTTQLADAMQGDEFYSRYGNSALLFEGKVINVQTENGKSIVTFETTGSYALECQFDSDIQIKSGASLSVAAPGGSAERLPHGVLMHDCVKN